MAIASDAWTTDDDESNIFVTRTSDGRVLLTVATVTGSQGVTLNLHEQKRLADFLTDAS
jgi:hypothetical protein